MTLMYPAWRGAIRGRGISSGFAAAAPPFHGNGILVKLHNGAAEDVRQENGRDGL